MLTDWEIKNYISNGEIVISPYDERLVNPSSLDFRLGNKYTFTKPISYNKFEGNVLIDALSPRGESYGCINPLNPTTFNLVTEEHEQLYILPNQTLCVSMLEYTKLPGNLSAKIYGKSSLARLGLDQSSPGGHIDPNWAGYLTLELTNHAEYAILLTHGMKIGQLVFFKHNEVEKGYQETGRYYNQEAGAGSRGI